QPDQHRARHRRRAARADAARGDRRPAWAAPGGRGAAGDAARPGCRGRCLMAKLRITQIRSGIGGTRNQRETLRTLGLRRIRPSTEREDSPQVRGMIKTVTHLVKVEEIAVAKAPSADEPTGAGEG